jgi:hypothetical protein
MFFRLVQPNLVSGLSAALLTLAIVKGLSFHPTKRYFETSMKDGKLCEEPLHFSMENNQLF